MWRTPLSSLSMCQYRNFKLFFFQFKQTRFFGGIEGSGDWNLFSLLEWGNIKAWALGSDLCGDRLS